MSDNTVTTADRIDEQADEIMRLQEAITCAVALLDQNYGPIKADLAHKVLTALKTSQWTTV